ncbi:MAG TPA: hypothetical protein VI698_02625 [Nitrososphaerales archaeon]|nr:hypothetical protein [Nitrososphaerales archaeon]
MDATKTGFFSKYRDYVLFNKNLIISGTSAILTSALVAQLYARYDTNALANSIVAIAAEYGVYIPFFAFLFYRDNRHKYIDPLTGKRDSKKVRNDVKKLFATFSISEIIFSVTRTSAHYQLLQSGAEAYQASMIGSLIAWAVFFVCINAGVKFVRLFKKV